MTSEATDQTREAQLLARACQRLGLVDDDGAPVPYRLAALVYGSAHEARRLNGNLYAALKGRRQVPRQVLVEVLAMVLDSGVQLAMPAAPAEQWVHIPPDIDQGGAFDQARPVEALCRWTGVQGWCAGCRAVYLEALADELDTASKPARS